MHVQVKRDSQNKIKKKYIINPNEKEICKKLLLKLDRIRSSNYLSNKTMMWQNKFVSHLLNMVIKTFKMMCSSSLVYYVGDRFCNEKESAKKCEQTLQVVHWQDGWYNNDDDKWESFC